MLTWVTSGSTTLAGISRPSPLLFTLQVPSLHWRGHTGHIRLEAQMETGLALTLQCILYQCLSGLDSTFLFLHYPGETPSIPCCSVCFCCSPTSPLPLTPCSFSDYSLVLLLASHRLFVEHVVLNPIFQVSITEANRDQGSHPGSHDYTDREPRALVDTASVYPALPHSALCWPA